MLQLVLGASYAAFWLDPRPTSDTTVDFAVFFTSPFVFAVALVMGVLSQRWRSGGILLPLAGNVLMLLCLVASAGWLALLGLLEVLLTLD